MVDADGQVEDEPGRDLPLDDTGPHAASADQDREGKPRKVCGKESEEMKQLRKQLRDVTEERDILKKALAYFAKEKS